MQRIKIVPHFKTQQAILYWGQLVGFCDTRHNMPVCFLAGRKLNILELEEKADVIEYVMGQFGSVRRTAQTRKAFDVIDRRHSQRE